MKNFVHIASIALGLLVGHSVQAAEEKIKANSRVQQGRYAYEVNQTNNTLQILDVTDPKSPLLIGTVETEKSPVSVYVDGRWAFVLNNDEREFHVATIPNVQIFDVSNPTAPVLDHSLPTYNQYTSVHSKNGKNIKIPDAVQKRMDQLYLEWKRRNPDVKELLAAARDGDIEGIKKALTGVDIDSQNEAGITALMRAAQNNKVEAVEFLLSKKADPTITDNMGMSALEFALYAHPATSKPVQRRIKRILELLLQAGAPKTKNAYKTAVKFGYPQDITALL
ncbi:MAG: ankyrin repeat domain-containing protein [Candidatus Babeliales bacterium]